MATNRGRGTAINVNLGGIANAHRNMGMSLHAGMQNIGGGIAQAGKFSGIASLAGSGIAAGGHLLGGVTSGIFGLVMAREQMKLQREMPSIHTEQYKARTLFSEQRALNAGIPLSMHYGIPTATATQYAGPGVTYGRSFNNLPVTGTGLAQGLNMGYL